MSTALIIGAGTSLDFSQWPPNSQPPNEFEAFPLGSDLIRSISKRVVDFGEKDPYWSENLNKKFGIDYKVLNAFHKALEDWQKTGQSIDCFLNKNPIYKNIGKLSIVFTILGCEGNSKCTGSFKNGSWKSSWLAAVDDMFFADSLQAACKTLKVVTFNYDRIVEHFFYDAKKYGDAIAPFAANNIVHIYGEIGKLKWQNNTKFIDYGHANDDKPKLLEAAENCNLMFDERKKTPNVDIAKNFLKGADKILILGFGYDTQNMDLLGLSKLSKSKKIIGYLYPPDAASLESDLLRYFENRIALIKTGTCGEFIQNNAVDS